MKKLITVLLLLQFMLAINLRADDMTYTWSFASDLSGTASNSQVIPNAVLGSSIGGTAFGYTFGTVAGWARVATSPNLPYTSYNENGYVQVVVTPPVSTKLTLSSITANLLGGGTGSVRIAAYYSFNNFSTTPGTNIGTATYNGVSGKTTTTDASLNIISNSSATATLQGLTEFSPSITVNAGQSLYIRFYAWAGSASRYLAIKNIVVSGTTESLQNTVNLTTSVTPTEGGTVLPVSSTVESGSNVVLTATRAFGYNFKEWRGGNSNTVISTTNPLTITPTTDTSIVAVFNPIATYSFTVDKIGSGANWGQIALSPSPTNGKYETGTEVTMTVVGNGVTSFNYWDNTSTNVSRIVKVTKDTTISASFDLLPFIVGWDFKNTSPNSDRPSDYYYSTSNQGMFSMKNPDGTSASWLASAGRFSPSYPCASMWTPVANWPAPRYFETSFSTVGFKNICVSSMLAASYHAYPVVDLWYSTDGTNYTKTKSVDISSVYGSGWVELKDTLPADANNQTKLYVRWLPDATSTPVLGNPTDVDGTTISNIFIYADDESIVDPLPPTLIASVPAEGASSVLANGSIVLTFDKRVKAGAGDCTLNGTVLTPSLGSKTVSFPYTKLAYNTDYTFVVPDSAITNINGVKYSGITLNFHTMNRPTPTAKLFDAVVAKDGSGDYTGIQAAINAAPTGRVQPWLIFIKNGTYKGHVDIPSSKPYLNFIGQERDSVIISDSRLAGASTVFPDSTVYSVDPGASVVVKAANCYFENVCFENKFGYDMQTGPQALAVYSNCDRIIFKNCWMRSYQDTYLTSSTSTARGYLLNCKIQGAVDFIYGKGDFFFDNCSIYCTRPSGGYIVAPNHPLSTAWGYVFNNCTLDGPSGKTITTYLGRPWHDRPKVSFMNTKSNINIYPVGWWYKMGGIPYAFAEYNTMDGSGNPLDMSQRINTYQIDSTGTYNDIKASIPYATTVSAVTSGNTTTWTYTDIKNNYTDAEATQFTYENIVSGSDNWDPRLTTEATDAPSNVMNTIGTISWDETPYAICYVILKNNKVLGFTTSTTYTDAATKAAVLNSYKTATSDVYKVIAVAESGALSSPTIAKGGTSSITSNQGASAVKAYFENNNLVVKNLELGSTIYVYSFNGMLTAKRLADTTIEAIPSMPSCIVRVVSKGNVTNLKVIK